MAKSPLKKTKHVFVLDCMKKGTSVKHTKKQDEFQDRSKKGKSKRHKGAFTETPFETNLDVSDKSQGANISLPNYKDQMPFSTFLKKDYSTLKLTDNQKESKKSKRFDGGKRRHQSWPLSHHGQTEVVEKCVYNSDQVECTTMSENKKRKLHKPDGCSSAKQRKRQSKSEERERKNRARRVLSGNGETSTMTVTSHSNVLENDAQEDEDSRFQRKPFQPQSLPAPSSLKSQYKVKKQSLDGLVEKDISERHTEELRCEEVDGGYLLHVKHPETVTFHGKALMSVLCGEVHLFGHKMTSDSPPVRIFSPTSHSLLTLSFEKGKHGSKKKKKRAVASSCRNHQLSEKDSESIISDVRANSIVVLLRKVDDACCDLVTRFSPFQSLFGKYSAEQHPCQSFPSINEALGSIGAQVGSPTDKALPVINIPSDFLAVRDKWLKALEDKEVAKMLSCGGKNSGKSTLNRYLINCTLQRASSVCYLECDVGQTEFSPPGCIALHQINAPILGPPFTHQQDPHYMCFFGLVSPSENPRLYSTCIQQVYGAYEKMDPKPPLIINTMGWNKGLGVNLLVDTCHITCPDHIVQLDSMNQANNFPAITPDFVQASPGWLYNRDTQNVGDKTKFFHELTIVDSPVVPSIESQFRFPARDHRDLSILGYFSKCLKPGENLQDVMPFCVPWKYLALHTTHLAVPPSELLAALNASIVGLCVADFRKGSRPKDRPDLPLYFDRTPVCQCLGMGIVRGVDMEKQEIYLITPLELTSLQRVNTLIRGSMNLPEQVLLKQKSEGNIPYVGTHLSMTGASSVRPRRYMPRKRHEPIQ